MIYFERVNLGGFGKHSGMDSTVSFLSGCLRKGAKTREKTFKDEVFLWYSVSPVSGCNVMVDQYTNQPSTLSGSERVEIAVRSRDGYGSAFLVSKVFSSTLC